MLDQTYFVRYANDNAPYTVDENVEEVVQTLEQIAKPLLKWFKGNKMKVNPDNCYLLLSDKEDIGINVGNIAIKNSHSEKLVGVFGKEGYLVKASTKLQTLAHVPPYDDL